MNKPEITYSAMGRFLNCPRSYYWAYERGLRPAVESEPLTFGRAAHDALAAFYEGFRRPAWHIAKPLDPLEDPFQTEKLHAMLRAYFARWYEHDLAHIKPLAVEHQFSGPIRNPAPGGRVSRAYTMAGKVDLVCEYEGALWIMEHKTTGQITGDYLDRLWTDRQALLYQMYIERDFGRPVAGVLYNILEKCRLRPLKNQEPDGGAARVADWYAENSATAFQRQELIFTPEQRAEVEREVWLITAQIREAARSGVWLMNPSNCYQYRSQCPYFGLCKYGPSPALLAGFEVQGRNPELDNDNKEDENGSATDRPF